MSHVVDRIARWASTAPDRSRSALNRLIAAVAGCLIAWLVLSGAAKAEEAKRFDLVIAERSLVSGGPTIRATQGDRVELAWTSDEAVELHLHGYDLALQVPAGELAVLAFTAAVAGRFPMTSHGFAGGGDHSHRPLLYIEIYPE